MPGPAQPPATLYQAILGPAYAELPLALRAFHAQVGGGHAQGLLKVERGRGPLARLAGWFIRAPPAGDAVPVDLRVHVEGDGARERWVRRFGERTMVTHQWRSGASLIEAVSLTQLRFELHASADAMRFEQRRCTCLGLPLPAFLAPRISVEAGVGPGTPADAWDIRVRVSLPILGLVVAYAGTMIPDS